MSEEDYGPMPDMGHPKVANGVVCVDFDGTIRPFGDIFAYPEPLPGAKAFLDRLREEGYHIVIFTSRLSTVWHASEGRDPLTGIIEQVGYIQEYFTRFDLPADNITAEKIPAQAYIDDKAIAFRGSWPQAGESFYSLVNREAE